MQLKTINAILSKQDVILLAPTGGGKSLCFQLPALVTKGISIIISPLISLMEDQIWALEELGIGAKMLSSTTDKDTNAQIMKLLGEKSSSNDAMKLLYVTPERLAKSKRFMNMLQKAHNLKKLDRFAIDEVHCCSQWGHDFRPDYKFLGTLKTLFPDVSILGVTATATAKVITDVQKMLNIRNSIVFRAPFNRPNLYYHVMEKPSEKEKTIEILATLLKKRYKGQSGIIYTYSIKDSEEITAELLKRDIKVRPYHANLNANQRTHVHSKWLSGSIQAVVATVAFGMGIDKGNVRFVIHHTMSKSMENFYQESGRAGRDGLPAECVLLYRLADIFKITTMMFAEHNGLRNAYSMVTYCLAGGINCRRDLIASHFTEVWSESCCNKMCDTCFYKDQPKESKTDISEDCKTLRRIIQRAEDLQMNLTALKLIDAWYDKGPSQLRAGRVPQYDRSFAEQVVAFLLVNDYLKEDFNFTPYTTISYIRISVAIIPASGIYIQRCQHYSLPTELCNTINPITANTNETKCEGAKKRKLVVIEDSSDSSNDDDDDIKLISYQKKSLKIENSSSESSDVCVEDISGVNARKKRKRAVESDDIIDLDKLDSNSLH